MPDVLPSELQQRPRSVSAAPRLLECELQHSGRSAAWLRLRGEMDLASAHQFAQWVEEALASAVLVMVDLRELCFIDRVGIRELISADARARRSGRRLVLVRGHGQVERIFELVGLSAHLDIIELRPILLDAQARERAPQ